MAANPQPVPGQAPSGFLRDEQYVALARATAAIGLWLRAMFELGVTYGMRKGELLGLRVRQVNLKEKLITLNPGETKNCQGRNLPMTTKVFELLHETIRGKAPEDYVFTRERNALGYRTRKDGHIVDMREAWGQATKDAGCPGLLFRDLSRTGAARVIGFLVQPIGDQLTLKWFTQERFLPMREAQWAPSTRETNMYNINQHILPGLGVVPLAKLDKSKCQTFLNDLASPRNGAAHGFSFTVVDQNRKILIDHNRTMLKAILEEAVDAELIGENPARKLVNTETHRAIARKSYHARSSEISQRKKERYDHERAERAAKGIIVDPGTASRMGGLGAAPRRELQQAWTINLFARMAAIIEENWGSHHTRKSLRWAFRLILTHAEKSGLAHERDITPGWLAAGLPRQTKDLRKEPIYRSNFGRMLQRVELWSEDQYQLFRKILAASKRGVNPGRRTHGPKPSPSPPNELCRLVRELALRCGLSPGEMRELRVTYIQADGLRVPPKPKSEKPGRLIPKLGRLIPFGDGRDELPKTILDAYVRKEKPTDYLFFSRSPRDKKKPLSKMTLAGAATTATTTMKALRNQHLDKDFSCARSLQEIRFHLRTYIILRTSMSMA